MERGEGAVASIPGNEGRITQAWVNVRGGMRVLAAYFWHTEGGTPRNEAILDAVLERARVTKTSVAGSMCCQQESSGFLEKPLNSN